MAEDASRPAEGSSGAEAREAIAAFEQILEFQPDDTATLDALAQSYELIGDPARARIHLIHLGRVLLGQADREAAARLMERLKPLSAGDAEIAALSEDLHNLALTAPAAPEPAPAAEAQGARRAVHFEEELALAWSLHEADLLTQEEYAAVVHDLTESSGEQAATVSVLHALRKRSFARMDDVLAHIASRSGRPVIGLAFFDAAFDTASILPLDFMIQRGVAFFGVVGPEALVAVLNPMNAKLRQDLEAILHKRCHLFLTSPTDFDAWIARARDIVSREGSGPPA